MTFDVFALYYAEQLALELEALGHAIKQMERQLQQEAKSVVSSISEWHTALSRLWSRPLKKLSRRFLKIRNWTKKKKKRNINNNSIGLSLMLIIVICI